jgi:hypothetical protein
MLLRSRDLSRPHFQLTLSAFEKVLHFATTNKIIDLELQPNAALT